MKQQHTRKTHLASDQQKINKQQEKDWLQHTDAVRRVFDSDNDNLLIKSQVCSCKKSEWNDFHLGAIAMWLGVCEAGERLLRRLLCRILTQGSTKFVPPGRHKRSGTAWTMAMFSVPLPDSLLWLPFSTSVPPGIASLVSFWSRSLFFPSFLQDIFTPKLYLCCLSVQ